MIEAVAEKKPLAGGPAPVPAASPSWRKRHPTFARAILYGTLVAIGVAAWSMLRSRAAKDEEDRQAGLVTRILGAELRRSMDPAGSLQDLRENVLAANPSEHVRLKAWLAEAATLDFMRRFDEAEAAYAKIAAAWPASTPRGALVLPWANMRVRAGHPTEGLLLLEIPGATEGEPEADVTAIRTAAKQAAGRSPDATDGARGR